MGPPRVSHPPECHGLCRIAVTAQPRSLVSTVVGLALRFNFLRDSSVALNTGGRRSHNISGIQGHQWSLYIPPSGILDLWTRVISSPSRGVGRVTGFFAQLSTIPLPLPKPLQIYPITEQVLNGAKCWPRGPARSVVNPPGPSCWLLPCTPND